MFRRRLSRLPSDPVELEQPPAPDAGGLPPLRLHQLQGKPQRSGGRRQPIAPRPASVTNIRPRPGAGLSYELGIDSFFGASHAMRPTGERHTHSFRIQARFVTDRIDDNGMIVGFRDVSDLLEAEARRYANRFLNDIEPFTVIQPTGENVAAVVYRDLADALELTIPGGPELIAITLWENPTSYVRVGPRRSGE